ncbi:hypothetical protein COHA_005835 [Chlorella ohadii]|uniref:CBM20 domain-containing protein n=1 Tax=Chlorella ohadii TaxID=2649997 RepID=A0AAD5DU34_9CHLO|nr:hypothetical protein COHA_005835 [Chlorella ohadii]
MRAAVAAPSAARATMPRLAPASARPSARPAIRRAPVRRASYHTAVVQASHTSDGADTMAVTFKLNRKVNFGQELVLVGSTDSLGGWELARAPHMTWNEGDLWTATIELPAGTHVEYKFALWDPHSPPVWENCPNRAFSVPAATVVTCAWDEPGATTCEPALEDGSSDSIQDVPAPAFRPATVVASYEANGHVTVEGRTTTAVKNGKASATDGAYSAEQLDFLKRKLETTHAAPSAVRQPAVYPNGHANGHANGSAEYTPEQLEFLRRSGKLNGSASPAPSQPARGASPAAASSAGGAQYTPEQLAFLQRSGKSPSPAPAAPALPLLDDTAHRHDVARGAPSLA